MTNENKNPFMQDWLRTLSMTFPGFTKHDCDYALGILTVPELRVLATMLRNRCVACGALRPDVAGRRGSFTVCEYPVPDEGYGPAPLRDACLMYAERLTKAHAAEFGAFRDVPTGYNALMSGAAVAVDLAIRRAEARPVASGVLTPSDTGRPYNA